MPPSDLLPMLARIKTTVFGLEELRTAMSPLSRARETREVAGLSARAVVEPDLKEWN